ncbi:hypothetical protein PVK06_035342 [Gossypium arboreum]|uniref:Uncharacterized protein n=1 Tax=Gossypium arboreum TaxID=29729 RepID=A0ABR0NGJ8_GOSAR|nr:hypothetical protein PVK06_035342 [Gossypium arboreum]
MEEFSKFPPLPLKFLQTSSQRVVNVEAKVCIGVASRGFPASEPSPPTPWLGSPRIGILVSQAKKDSVSSAIYWTEALYACRSYVKDYLLERRAVSDSTRSASALAQVF